MRDGTYSRLEHAHRSILITAIVLRMEGLLVLCLHQETSFIESLLEGFPITELIVEQSREPFGSPIIDRPLHANDIDSESCQPMSVVCTEACIQD